MCNLNLIKYFLKENLNCTYTNVIINAHLVIYFVGGFAKRHQHFIVRPTSSEIFGRSEHAPFFIGTLVIQIFLTPRLLRALQA
jgi:hypothetical protein